MLEKGKGVNSGNQRGIAKDRSKLLREVIVRQIDNSESSFLSRLMLVVHIA